MSYVCCVNFFLSKYTKLGYAGNTEPQLIIPSSRAGKRGEGRLTERENKKEKGKGSRWIGAWETVPGRNCTNNHTQQFTISFEHCGKKIGQHPSWCAC